MKIWLTIFSLVLTLISTPGEPLDVTKMKEKVRRMFQHAYDGYLRYAYPLDELQPLTCDGRDTWGSFSLTLVDSLDTLLIMGNASEFIRASKLLLNNLNLQKDVNISVFETNIRVIGGLISAHLLSYRVAGDAYQLDPGWPCDGPLLRLAEQFADKLLPAFDTFTGMPYGTVNLRHGTVPTNETSVTCVACIGTFILEFGALSRLTGDPRYEHSAIRALKAIWQYRSVLGLLGNHIDVQTGRWVAEEATIGTATDSLFEYLVKGSQLFRLPELHAMFLGYKESIDKHLRSSQWHFMVHRSTGALNLPVFQSLEAFWPSILVLSGDLHSAVEHLLTYYDVWKRYGHLPEFFSPKSQSPLVNRQSAPLRPEFIESIYYAYQATKDPLLLEMATDIVFALDQSAKTECGYASIRDVTRHSLENRMESFFLAETLKYLYLIFDENNFLHSQAFHQRMLPSGQVCHLGSSGYLFNTEAHPIDPGALECCHFNLQQHQLQYHDNGKTSPNVSFSSTLSSSSLLQQVSTLMTGMQGKQQQQEDIYDRFLQGLWTDLSPHLTLIDESSNSTSLPLPAIASDHHGDLKQWLGTTQLMTCPSPSFTDRIMAVEQMRVQGTRSRL